MAQDGDTITYTYQGNGTSVSEDVSNVNEVVVEYCDGAGGESVATSGGAGGRVENATIDVSNQSTIYIWVASRISRYYGGVSQTYGTSGGGSSEISLSDTDAEDSSDEPFLVAAGGGAGGEGEYDTQGSAGARGGSGVNDGFGVAPPAGGNANGGDGDGAIDDQNRGLVSGGTTIKGGGSSSNTADVADGEIKLSFKSTLSPPDPPSNLTAEVQ